MSDPVALAPAIALEKVNRQHFVILEHGKFWVITEHFNSQLHRRELMRSSAQDFRLRYANEFVWENEKKFQLGKWWLEHPERRMYSEIVCDPDPNRQPNDLQYNLWRGFGVRPAPGTWARLRDHLFTICSSGDDEIFQFTMNWITYLVQYPHLTPGTAIVWQGRQGAGKGLIARAIGKLVGHQHFAHVTQTKHLVGHFNAHLREAIVIFADEAFWAGDKQAEGSLKALITEPTFMMEAKGQNAQTVPNRAHVMIATNNEWAAPVAADDRRFMISEVSDRRIGDREYFRAIHHEMDHGGIEAMLWDLTHTAPMTAPPRIPESAAAHAARWSQKYQTMSPQLRWIFGKLDAGMLITHGSQTTEWPVEGRAEVKRSELHRDYLAEMEDLRVTHRSSETAVGMFLTKLFPDIDSVRRRGDFSRERYWRLPNLEAARQAFENHINMAIFTRQEIETDEAGNIGVRPFLASK